MTAEERRERERRSQSSVGRRTMGLLEALRATTDAEALWELLDPIDEALARAGVTTEGPQGTHNNNKGT